MLNIYICEDDKYTLGVIKKTIIDDIKTNQRDMKVALASQDPFDLLKDLENHSKSSLYFLDIYLESKIDGIKLATKIRNFNPDAYIIFITADAKQHLMVFKYKITALDYIVKDNAENIKQRIRECLAYVSKQMITKHKTNKNVLSISDGGLSKVISIEDIILVKTADSHLKKLALYTRNGSYIFNGSLKNIEEQLKTAKDIHFIYINRSTLVNLNKVDKLNQKQKTLLIGDDVELRCSRRHFKEVKKEFDLRKKKEDKPI